MGIQATSISYMDNWETIHKHHKFKHSRTPSKHSTGESHSQIFTLTFAHNSNQRGCLVFQPTALSRCWQSPGSGHADSNAIGRLTTGKQEVGRQEECEQVDKNLEETRQHREGPLTEEQLRNPRHFNPPVQNNGGSVKGACGPHTVLPSSYTVHMSGGWDCCFNCWENSQRHSPPDSPSVTSTLRLSPLACPGQLSASAGLMLPTVPAPHSFHAASTNAVNRKAGKQMHSPPPWCTRIYFSQTLTPLHPGLRSLCTSRNRHTCASLPTCLSVTDSSLAALSQYSISSHPSKLNSPFLVLPPETSV